jgi:hypothetical protein
VVWCTWCARRRRAEFGAVVMECAGRASSAVKKRAKCPARTARCCQHRSPLRCSEAEVNSREAGGRCRWGGADGVVQRWAEAGAGGCRNCGLDVFLLQWHSVTMAFSGGSVGSRDYVDCHATGSRRVVVDSRWRWSRSDLDRTWRMRRKKRDADALESGDRRLGPYVYLLAAFVSGLCCQGAHSLSWA